MVISTVIITILASLLLTIIYWRVNKVYVYLLVLMLAMGLFVILHQLFFYDGEIIATTILYTHFTPFFYLPGPMLFFFIRSILEDRDDLRLKNWKELLHFLPFLITLIGVFPYLFLPFDFKIQHVRTLVENPMVFKMANDNWLVPSSANAVLRPLLLLGYCMLSFFIIRRYQQKYKRLQKNYFQMKLTLRWLYALVTFMLAINICYLIIVVVYYSVNDIAAARALSFSPSVIVGFILLLIPVMLAIFPQLLYGIPLEKTKKFGFNEKETLKDVNFADKILHSVSKESEFASTVDAPLVQPLEHEANNILSYIETNKLFLDRDFNLEALSIKMNIPRNHLYYCFSNLINEKFTSYRTRLRVEHAKKLLLNGVAKKLSMEGIAVDSGFNSRSRFFSSFKEITGLTPMEFIEENKNIEQDPPLA